MDCDLKLSGGHVVVGSGTTIGSHALLANGARVGKDCRIHHGAVAAATSAYAVSSAKEVKMG